MNKIAEPNILPYRFRQHLHLSDNIIVRHTALIQDVIFNAIIYTLKRLVLVRGA